MPLVRLVLILALLAVPLPARAVTTVVAARLYPVTVSAGVTYWGNGSLTQPDPAVQTVVFVVHGTSLGAESYARSVLDAAKLAGRAGSTLVVAPLFDTTSRSGRLYWSSDGWKQGDESRSGAVSSFAVMDSMINTAGANFPAARVVVAGHSAGGQFVNRYAAGTKATPALFVVANPSSYLYLDGRRWKSGVLRALTSSEVSKCRGFDTYKYGVLGLNGYMSGAGSVMERYGQQPVTYLLGTADNDPTADDLDIGCEAQLQGSHRLQRGEQFYAALPAVYGSGVYDRHRKVLVPGAGHSAREMFTSAECRAVLFG